MLGVRSRRGRARRDARGSREIRRLLLEAGPALVGVRAHRSPRLLHERHRYVGRARGDLPGGLFPGALDRLGGNRRLRQRIERARPGRDRRELQQVRPAEYFAWRVLRVVRAPARHRPQRGRKGRGRRQDDRIGLGDRDEPDRREALERDPPLDLDRQIQAGTPDKTSAEWIVEAPFSCLRFTCHQAALANFGSVAIRGISATGNGRPGALGTAGWKATPLVLAPCVQTIASVRRNGLPAVAVPRRRSADGSSFAIAWGRETGRPPLCRAATTGAVGVLPDYTLG